MDEELDKVIFGMCCGVPYGGKKEEEDSDPLDNPPFRPEPVEEAEKNYKSLSPLRGKLVLEWLKQIKGDI